MTARSRRVRQALGLGRRLEAEARPAFGAAGLVIEGGGFGWFPLYPGGPQQPCERWRVLGTPCEVAIAFWLVDDHWRAHLTIVKRTAWTRDVKNGIELAQFVVPIVRRNCP